MYLNPAPHSISPPFVCVTQVIIIVMYLMVQVSVGFSHIVAVNNEHVVYSWGENSHGQLGHGDTKSRVAPEMIEALKGRPILR